MNQPDLKSMNGLPVQPIVMVDGVVRYRQNRIVKDIFGAASAGQKLDLNDIAHRIAKNPKVYTPEEQMQFAMLTGYSIGGSNDLSYFAEDVKEWAAAEAETLTTEAENQVEQKPGDPPAEKVFAEDKPAVSLTEAMKDVEKQDEE